MSVSDALDRRFPDLSGLRVLVIGAGKSGRAAARLAAGRGAEIVLADAKAADALGDVPALARDAGWSLSASGPARSDVERADLIVLSPGVPASGPWYDAARERETPVWGEVELASRFALGRVIGITGSNGKSTVTTMTGAMLRAAGIPGGTGGNLDVPFSDLLAEDADDAVHAVELSSFQLETVERFRAHVAAILNFSPDHLDRYADYDAYREAKAHILEGQTRDDVCVLNADDDAVAALAARAAGRVRTFTLGTPRAPGAGVRDGSLVLRHEDGRIEPILSRDRLPLAGDHNVANALAATLCAVEAGVPLAAAADTLASYRPLPHRLELVATVGGARYVNDSKATNRDAAERAVRAWPAGTVHWILGGRDKGTDWSVWPDDLWEHVREVQLIGEAAPRIDAGLPPHVARTVAGTLDEAVRSSAARTRSGDVVLLAPACASFDQFENFEARGDRFRALADALAAGEDA